MSKLGNEIWMKSRHLSEDTEKMFNEAVNFGFDLAFDKVIELLSECPSMANVRPTFCVELAEWLRKKKEGL